MTEDLDYDRRDRSLSFIAEGIPAPKGSKRALGAGRVVESSRAVGPWQRAVRVAACAAFADARLIEPFDGPLRVAILFRFAMPARRVKRIREHGIAWKSTRPDVDKCVRAVLDGLQPEIIADDCRVAALTVEQMEVRPTEGVWLGAQITISELGLP